jgi:hypothetical protein
MSDIDMAAELLVMAEAARTESTAGVWVSYAFLVAHGYSTERELFLRQLKTGRDLVKLLDERRGRIRELEAKLAEAEKRDIPGISAWLPTEQIQFNTDRSPQPASRAAGERDFDKAAIEYTRSGVAKLEPPQRGPVIGYDHGYDWDDT